MAGTDKRSSSVVGAGDSEREDDVGTNGIGIKTSPDLGDAVTGSAGKGGRMFGPPLVAFADAFSGATGAGSGAIRVGSGATRMAALVAPAGAGRGNGIAANIFGRARGSGTRMKASSELGAGRNPGRSRSWVGDKNCENAGVATRPVNTSAAKTVLMSNLITLLLT